MSKQDLSKIAERISFLVETGQQSTGQSEQLFLEMLRGPIAQYFDTEQVFDKEALEESIEASLSTIRQQYKQDSVTAKYLTGAFADCITLVNATKGLTPKEIARQLKQFGVSSNLQEAVELITTAQGSKQDQKMMELLKQVHYGQLLSFDYKF